MITAILAPKFGFLSFQSQLEFARTDIVLNVLVGNCGVRGTSAALTPTVIVIGAGFGGLAAARYLHNSNLEVRENPGDLGWLIFQSFIEFRQFLAAANCVQPSRRLHVILCFESSYVSERVI